MFFSTVNIPTSWQSGPDLIPSFFPQHEFIISAPATRQIDREIEVNHKARRCTVREDKSFHPSWTFTILTQWLLYNFLQRVAAYAPGRDFVAEQRQLRGFIARKWRLRRKFGDACVQRFTSISGERVAGVAQHKNAVNGNRETWISAGCLHKLYRVRAERRWFLM